MDWLGTLTFKEFTILHSNHDSRLPSSIAPFVAILLLWAMTSCGVPGPPDGYETSVGIGMKGGFYTVEFRGCRERTVALITGYLDGFKVWEITPPPGVRGLPRGLRFGEVPTGWSATKAPSIPINAGKMLAVEITVEIKFSSSSRFNNTPTARLVEGMVSTLGGELMTEAEFYEIPTNC